MPSFPLEPDRTRATDLGRAALDLVATFVDDLPDAPSTPLGPTVDELVSELLTAPPDAPRPASELLDRTHRAALAAIDTAGPGYMGYIPGGGLVSSAVAEMVARVVNRYTGFAHFSPALVAMEESVLRWLTGQFGLPDGAGGVLTTGGSNATLTAVVAARHHGLGTDLTGGAVYVCAGTHRSVAKAARVAGIAPDLIRSVPSTSDQRMDVDAAAHMMRQDRDAGLRPFLLVGTAGTTDLGVVDALGDLADVAADQGVWFHVDAAYGGFFQLTERGRRLFRGIERADSITLDPHKGLFLAYGTGALLVRSRHALREAFATDGAYLQDVAEGTALPDYADLGPELSRDFRGLRLWLPLHLHGVAAFRAALNEKLDLAARAHEVLADNSRIVVPWAPDLSTVAFHVVGDTPDGGLTRQVHDSVNADGRVFLSSTRVDGRYLLRICILSHRTHRPHLDLALSHIHSAAAEAQPQRILESGALGTPGSFP